MCTTKAEVKWNFFKKKTKSKMKTKIKTNKQPNRIKTVSEQVWVRTLWQSGWLNMQYGWTKQAS